MKKVLERIVVDTTPPASGDLWIDSSTDDLQLKYRSGNDEWISVGAGSEPEPENPGYFTIEASRDGTKVYFRQSSYAVTAGKPALKVQVSTDDGATWAEKTASAADGGVPGTLMAELDNGEKILIKGNNAAYGYYDETENWCVENCNFWADKSCYVYGNIMSLVSGDNYDSALSVSDCAFSWFFADYTGDLARWIMSKNGRTLVLPATTLGADCYDEMFGDCTELTIAPELPATTLADYCYYQMFIGCTGLSRAPQLPATILADYCYYYMFQGCTSLTQAPELPATTLAEGCYGSMFEGCSSLTTAPVLPATTLEDHCYEQMFKGCTSITTASELSATTLTQNCYKGMFDGCTSLVTAPALSATTLASYCYGSMFSDCTSLTQAPTLPATTLTSHCYSSMFWGCTNLTTAPELPATTLVSSCYDFMFYNCSKLNYIKAMFTTKPSSSYTGSWVNGVAATGTFVKNSSATWSVTGANGVPTGWTVETASS